MAETRLAEPHPSDAPDLALLMGLSLIAIGIVCLAISVATSFMTVFWVGGALIVDGVFTAFQARGRGAVSFRRLRLVPPLLAILVGLSLIGWPASSLRWLSPVLLVVFIADGALLIASSLSRGRVTSVTTLVTGTVIVLLGVAIGVRWRSLGMGLAGALTGLFLIGRGVLLIAGSFSARARLRRQVPA